jgi:hypothetical protein
VKGDPKAFKVMMETIENDPATLQAPPMTV